MMITEITVKVCGRRAQRTCLSAEIHRHVKSGHEAASTSILSQAFKLSLS